MHTYTISIALSYKRIPYTEVARTNYLADVGNFLGPAREIRQVAYLATSSLAVKFC